MLRSNSNSTSVLAATFFRKGITCGTVGPLGPIFRFFVGDCGSTIRSSSSSSPKSDDGAIGDEGGSDEPEDDAKD